MAKPIEIGSRSFKTQKSALDHYKQILHRYRDGERVADPSDHADLVSLIEQYDPILEEDGEPAKGCGQIGYFERRLNTGTGWSNSGFWVVRQDGTESPRGDSGLPRTFRTFGSMLPARSAMSVIYLASLGPGSGGQVWPWSSQSRRAQPAHYSACRRHLSGFLWHTTTRVTTSQSMTRRGIAKQVD